MSEMVIVGAGEGLLALAVSTLSSSSRGVEMDDVQGSEGGASEWSGGASVEPSLSPVRRDEGDVDGSHLERLQ